MSAACYSLTLAVVVAFSDFADWYATGTVVLVVALLVSVPLGAVAGCLLGLVIAPMTGTRAAWLGPGVLAAVLLALFVVLGIALASTGSDGAAVFALFGLVPGLFAAAGLLWHTSALIERRRLVA